MPQPHGGHGDPMPSTTAKAFPAHHPNLWQVAITRGCIPLIAMDGVKTEFEEQLPLMQYAVRIPSFMWYRTPEILHKFIEAGRAAEMQVRDLAG